MHVTTEKIYTIIAKAGTASPAYLLRQTGLSRAMLHRHLKRLLEQGLVEKLGKPPRVVYQPHQSNNQQSQALVEKINPANQQLIEQLYSYVSVTGHIKMGCEGFIEWAIKTNQHTNIQLLAKEYCVLQDELAQFRSGPVVEATKRFVNIFPDDIVKKIFYSDFYSIPKFGKTKLGYYVLHGKQAQDIKLIEKVAQMIKPQIEGIIKSQKIQAVAWIPHTLPREIPFLKELEKQLQLSLPRLPLMKGYSGQIPVAQKSLSKLSERIENAARTFYLEEAAVPFKRILLIDDAIGSGASMHEVAKKIVTKNPKASIFSYAVVGSYKGFEVIKEV